MSRRRLDDERRRTFAALRTIDEIPGQVDPSDRRRSRASSVSRLRSQPCVAPRYEARLIWNRAVAIHYGISKIKIALSEKGRNMRAVLRRSARLQQPCWSIKISGSPDKCPETKVVRSNTPRRQYQIIFKTNISRRIEIHPRNVAIFDRFAVSERKISARSDTRDRIAPAREIVVGEYFCDDQRSTTRPARNSSQGMVNETLARAFTRDTEEGRERRWVRKIVRH
ncbi:hypothetical protein KM043_006318 [Ampulex compressa]|nr:hypothetical protein KM043_006318 [Ampulex compressa]